MAGQNVDIPVHLHSGMVNERVIPNKATME